MKVGKFMTNQVVNKFGNVWWPSIISTPDIYPQPPCLDFFWNGPILMKGGREWLLCPPPCDQGQAYLAWCNLDVFTLLLIMGICKLDDVTYFGEFYKLGENLLLYLENTS